MQSLAFLTPEFPGVGGVIKKCPEDFLVEELPAYEPSGEGEHLFLFVEKRGMTTLEAQRRIARLFQISPREVSYAGMKDKHAVTRQHFSVRLPSKDRDDRARDLAQHGMTCLWAVRHGNKLRRGHLTGNRFVIRIREVEPTLVVRAKRTFDRLLQAGAPNYVGVQRFGYRGDNHELGRMLLQGRHEEFLSQMLGRPNDGESDVLRDARSAYDRGDIATCLELWPRRLRHERQALDALRQGRSPEQAVRAIAPVQLDFLVSATQSAIFNRVLHRRISEAGARGLGQLIEGDLAFKHENGAVFAVDAGTADVENAPEGRAARMEVSPTGPMWGTGMTRPSGRVLEQELAALAESGLEERHFSGGVANAEGARRPMRVTIRNGDVSGGVDEKGGYIRLAFDLPRGAFATTVLREIMKNEAASIDESTGTEDA